MRDITIDLDVMGDVIKSITDYNDRASYFGQMYTKDEKEKEKIKEINETRLKNLTASRWNDINLRVVKQGWGSTACGWEGMGGAAMTDSYTTVIENRLTRLAFVYYNGQLAYIADFNDKFKDVGNNLPDRIRCKKELDVIYKPKRV